MGAPFQAFLPPQPKDRQVATGGSNCGGGDGGDDGSGTFLYVIPVYSGHLREREQRFC